MRLPTPSSILDAKTAKELVRFYLDNRPFEIPNSDFWELNQLPEVSCFGERPKEFTGFNCWEFDELTEDGAKVIAKSGMDVVNLDTVAHVPLEAIRILCKAKSIKTLCLASLHEITPETAKILASFKGQSLNLNGLSQPSAELAECLATFPGSLSLGGLCHLEMDGAVGLAKHKGDLGLDGIMVLFEEEALAISKHQGTSLSFNSLFETPSKVKTILRQYQGVLKAPWAKKKTSKPKKKK